MSRIENKPRNRTAPRNSSTSKDPKLLLIKQKISQIASNMRSPLKPSNSSKTPDSQMGETRIRTPPRRKSNKPETLESFLISNGFENCINYFVENQITLVDFPYLTKEDLNDMSIPIGPRNRLLKLIEKMDKQETSSHYEASPKRAGIRDEVDKFMNELSQFSKRSEQRFRPSSREQSLDTSFDSEINSQRMCDNVIVMLKDISEKQNFMMKAIEENQKAIANLRTQYANNRKNRCICSEYR